MMMLFLSMVHGRRGGIETVTLRVAMEAWSEGIRLVLAFRKESVGSKWQRGQAWSSRISEKTLEEEEAGDLVTSPTEERWRRPELVSEISDGAPSTDSAREASDTAGEGRGPSTSLRGA